MARGVLAAVGDQVFMDRRFLRKNSLACADDQGLSLPSYIDKNRTA